MSIDVRVYDNGDHTALVWLPQDHAASPNCLGFTIKRNCDGQEDFLHGFVGFTEHEPFPKAATWHWPLQRYMWWDYHVKPGDTVKYQVIPVTGTPGNLQLDEDKASAWTAEMKVTGQCSPGVSAYFNRGVAAAQWVSRELDAEAKGQNAKKALGDIIQKRGDKLRDALGGQLKTEILALLDEAKGGEIYAALYELSDPELKAGLMALQKKAHVILANGAFSSKKPDENAQARADLKGGGVEVFDRMVSSGHFAHNKFAVICDADGNAKKVLTGSTNWSYTGLCTQANNGLIISDPQIANCFLEQWKRLKEAGNVFPKDLVVANSEIKQFTVDGVTVTPWFAPTAKHEDLDYARKLIANAKDGILFLFFNPGKYSEDIEKETLLQNILERNDAKLYVRGVVNQEIANLTKGKVPVTLYGESAKPELPLSLDAIVPANIKNQFHDWNSELLGESMVMVHSKVIVLDPFGQHPVLMTGSHNLGLKASAKNDDNLVIIEGASAAPLAASYAVNIVAIYQTYRWNSYVTAHAGDNKAWHGLQPNSDWQTGHLSGDNLAELQFWTANELVAPEPEAVAAAAPGHHGTTHQPRTWAQTIRMARTPPRHRNHDA